VPIGPTGPGLGYGHILAIGLLAVLSRQILTRRCSSVIISLEFQKRSSAFSISWHKIDVENFQETLSYVFFPHSLSVRRLAQICGDVRSPEFFLTIKESGFNTSNALYF
jgi:hypothetical protein